MLQQKKRSVIKLSSMPLAMQEKAIILFFQQFGNVTRYCLKRHRYGRSLRYGYVEFDHPEIAKIVEETLNCTMLYGHMLECRVIPPEEVNGSQFFKTRSILKARQLRQFDHSKAKWNNHATIVNLEFQFPEWHKKLVKDEKTINSNLKRHGINYQFHGFEEEIQQKLSKQETETKTETETK